jgi:hypothetical protein
MYENKREPVAPKAVFYGRILKSLGVASALLGVCLIIGILGYHYIAHIVWIDAIHNASMILSGMGPVAEVKNVSGKLFSSAYALFSGVAFITNIGIVLAPAAHRLFHRLHVDDKDDNGESNSSA